MKEKRNVEKKTIKQMVIEDFQINIKLARDKNMGYFPSGLLKYYLYDKGFLTYAGRIIGEYCKANEIKIVRASEIGCSIWEGENIHGNMKVFLFDTSK